MMLRRTTLNPLGNFCLFLSFKFLSSQPTACFPHGADALSNSPLLWILTPHSDDSANPKQFEYNTVVIPHSAVTRLLVGWVTNHDLISSCGRILFSPQQPDQPSAHTASSSNGYGHFPCGWSIQSTKLTTHQHPMPRSRMHVATLPLTMHLTHSTQLTTRYLKIIQHESICIKMGSQAKCNPSTTGCTICS